MSKSEDIKKNSHTIWLAGLGAYAMMEELGKEQFERMVARGSEFEEKNTYKTETPETPLDELKVRANQTMNKIERAFDLRVSSTLGRLGISRKTDLDILNNKVDRLSNVLDALNKEVISKPSPNNPSAPKGGT